MRLAVGHAFTAMAMSRLKHRSDFSRQTPRRDWPGAKPLCADRARSARPRRCWRAPFKSDAPQPARIDLLPRNIAAASPNANGPLGTLSETRLLGSWRGRCGLPILRAGRCGDERADGLSPLPDGGFPATWCTAPLDRFARHAGRRLCGACASVDADFAIRHRRACRGRAYPKHPGRRRAARATTTAPQSARHGPPAPGEPNAQSPGPQPSALSPQPSALSPPRRRDRPPASRQASRRG
jgi:hypothetical protein